jgi:VWFA-related protein
MDPNSPFAQNEFRRNENQVNNGDGTSGSPQTDPFSQQQKQSEQFADADLARELGELTRTANRANVTMYTIDPRGLVGMSDIDEQVDPTQWNEFVRKSQDSLRVIADETGGLAVVNQNDFSKALKRIDAETSDYYVLGYYSKNPDITKRRRTVEVRINRAGQKWQVFSRKEYVLKAPPRPATSKQD